MTCLEVCEKCQSTAIFLEEAAPYVVAPHCITCGRWYHTPEAPPILESDKAKRALPLTQWSKQQREHGLCGNCDEAALPGSHYCADHLEFHQSQCKRMQEGAA